MRNFPIKKGWKKHFGYMPQDIGIDVNLSALEVVLLGNLDEPVSALDMHHQCVLLDCLRKQTREKGLITLVILHDLSLASEFCDEIIFLHHSRIWARGLPSQILEHSLLQDIYKVNAKIFYDDRGTPAVIAKSAILEELR